MGSCLMKSFVHSIQLINHGVNGEIDTIFEKKVAVCCKFRFMTFYFVTACLSQKKGSHEQANLTNDPWWPKENKTVCIKWQKCKIRLWQK